MASLINLDILSFSISSEKPTFVEMSGQDTKSPSEKNQQQNEIDNTVGTTAELKAPDSVLFRGREIKFSVKARTRIINMTKQGTTYQEALELEVARQDESASTTETNGSKASSTGTKRICESQERKRKKKPKTNSDRIFKIGIISEDYPEQFLSNQQLKRIESAILKAIDNLPTNGPKIKFSSCNIKPGFMVITCDDYTSRTWLIGLIKSWPPLDGIKLKWVDRADAPKRFVYKVYVPDVNETCNSFLNRLSKQNDLNTEEWKTLHSKKDGSGLFVVVSLDEYSHEKLLNMDLEVHFNFGKVRFLPKKQSKETDQKDDGELLSSTAPSERYHFNL